MSGSLGQLNIQLALDQVKFQDGLTKAQRHAKQFAERTNTYLKNIENAAIATNKSLDFADKLNKLKVLSFVLPNPKQIIGSLDNYTELSNKINLVTESERERIKAMQDVYDISLKTAQSTQATSSVYQTFAQNAQQLGLDLSDVAALTETVAKSVAISGANSATASNALIQFGQSLLMGKLKAQEFNSLMTQTPTVIQAIAKGLGITTAQLKAMVDKGEMTADKMVEGLKKAQGSVDELHKKTTTTLSGAFQNLSTATEKWLGETDKALATSKLFAEGINVVANNIGTLAPLTLSLGAAVAGIKFSQKAKSAYLSASATMQEAKATVQATLAEKAKITADLQATQAYIAQLQAQLNLAKTEQARLLLSKELGAQTARETALIKAQTAAINQLNVAKKSASTLGMAMAALGGPLGVATLAISAAIPFLLDWGNSASDAANKSNDFANSVDNIKQNLDKFTVAQLKDKLLDAKYSIEEQKKKVQELEQQYKTFQNAATNAVQKIEWKDHSGNKHIQYLKRSVEDMAKAEERAIRIKAQLETETAKLNDQTSLQAQLQDKLNEKVEQANNSLAQHKLKLNDWEKAQQDIEKQTKSLTEEVNVLTLESKGNAKAAFILSGLYKVLSVEGADYANVLAAIAKGEYASAEAASKTIDMSLEDLQKIFAAKEQLEALFQQDEKKTKLKKTIELNHKKGKGGENARQNWLNFYDEVRQKSTSTLGEIDLEQARMFRRLEEYNKKGVVQHQEYEAAKLAITQRFNQQRLELAGKYAPNKLAAHNLDKELAAVKELQAANQLTIDEAKQAAMKLQIEYAQNVAQNAVTPLDQLRAIYDPNQAIQNQQTQELAQLEAFHQQKLMTEEEFQKRKKEIIDRYKNDAFQREMNNYATGLNNLGGAFGNLASMIEQSGGRQSAAYKAMFAVSKAFAIAESMVKLSQAISQAMADPAALTPAQKFANMAAVASVGMNVVSQIMSVGFASGGYTGLGGKYTPAGIVHKGEYVITKEATSRLGVDYLNFLNYGTRRGFANGGGVAVPKVPVVKSKTQNANVSIKVINNGEPVDAKVTQKQQGEQLQVTVELMRKIAKQEASSMLQTNFRAGGAFA